MNKTKLAVALDFSSLLDADRLIISLGEAPVVYKVGLELFLSAGPEWVRRLTESGKSVFLDLKFHDIPNTVAKSVFMANELGVEYTTVHLSGGPRMFDEIAKQNRNRKLKVLGVSVLTSFDEAEWSQVASAVSGLTISTSPEKSVASLVAMNTQIPKSREGLDGVVCSPFEIPIVKSFDSDLFVTVPGIRPSGQDKGDQRRVMTPEEASQRGAHMIVVGRPITKDANPAKVTRDILLALG